MIPEQALRNLLSGTQSKIAAIDADLASMNVVSREEYWHQGYQSGRKAELESLESVLEMALQNATPTKGDI
jgi:hypothetical protein